MADFEKRIELSENRILIYRISEGYAKPTFTITEGFLENGDLIKTYSLSQWDDYGLNSWINDDEDVTKISFEFDMNHPLYFPLFHLLNYDDQLIIDDDGTMEENKKYMLVRREEEKIYIDFIDLVEDDIYASERFNVFIKNIGIDGRSKIDQNYKDTKERLLIFFNEVYDIIMNDYHQTTIEEYIIKNSKDTETEKIKQFYKKNFN